MARYSDEFRAQAVLMLEAAGYPETKGALTKTARALGIKVMTLSRWGRRTQNPPPNKLVSEKVFDLKEALLNEVQAILEEFPNARPDADYRELGTVLGIVVDKLQLLDGKATERVEILTEQERTTRIAELYDTARTRRDRRDSERIQ